MRRLAPAAVLALVLLLNSSAARAAESGKLYTPRYQYTGPQGSVISDEEIKGKDPMLATVFSLLPGCVVHGFGNYYAGDYDFGTRMLITELVGGAVWAWGEHIIHNPQDWTAYWGESQDYTTQQAGYWITAGGVALFLLSWLGDVATAHRAADSYNQDHQIEFQLDTRLDRPGISLAYKF